MDAPWDERSEADLGAAVRRTDGPPASKAADLAAFRSQRHAALCVEGTRVGTLVYEVLDRELFISALAASAPGIDLLATFAGPIRDLARAHKCEGIRFGTSRPALVEKAKDLGYRVASVVMRQSV